MSLLHVCHVSWLTDKFILVMVICMFSWYFTQLLRPSLPHLVSLYCCQTVFNPRCPLKLCRKPVRDKNTSITMIIQVKRCAARDLLSLNYPAIRLNTPFRKKRLSSLIKILQCRVYYISKYAETVLRTTYIDGFPQIKTKMRHRVYESNPKM